MIKSFGLSSIRRATAPAFFFSVLFALGAFGARELGAQTYVTNNGIIMERVAEEDVREVERLNEESEAEDERERARLAELRAAGEAEGDSEQEATEDIEEADAIDELFGDDSEGDTETAVTTPTTEIVKIDKKDKPVEFSGDLSAELGGYFYLYPWKKSKPFATFSNTLKFVGRPRNDFYVYGSFVTSFPEMDFGVYELYFDYTLFGQDGHFLGAFKNVVHKHYRRRMLDYNRRGRFSQAQQKVHRLKIHFVRQRADFFLSFNTGLGAIRKQRASRRHNGGLHFGCWKG